MEMSPLSVVKDFFSGKKVRIECAYKLSDDEFRKIDVVKPSQIFMADNSYNEYKLNEWVRVKKLSRIGEKSFYLNVFYLGQLELKIYSVEIKGHKFVFDIERIGKIEKDKISVFDVVD